MQALISYRNDRGQSMEFARWLHGALLQRDSPLKPKMDEYDLVPIGSFERQLPVFVLACDIVLFVAGEHSTASEACLGELKRAREYGKPIIVLVIHASAAADPLIRDHYRVDFTGDRRASLRRLFARVATLRTPEGTIVHLQEQHRIRCDKLRRLPPERQSAERAEIDAIERRIRELIAVEEESRASFWTSPAGSTTPSGPAGSAQPVPELAEKLRQPQPPVILVVGPEGAGKTRMIEQLTPAAATWAADIGHVVHYRAYGPRSFRADSLADILEADRQPVGEPPSRAGRDVLERFRCLLAVPADRRLTVVVDSAQNLFDHTSGHLADPELDDAFEVLATVNPSCAVKLVIVTRESPMARHRRWFESAARVQVDGGMPVEEFGAYLASKDENDDYGLARPAPELVSALHAASGGRPRAADLVARILTTSSRIADGDEGRLDSLARIVAALRTVPEAEVLDFLVGHLVAGLTEDARRTARALAALRGPVPPAAIAYMFVDAQAGQIDLDLRHLRARHLAHLTPDGRWYVQAPDDDRILEPVRYAADPEEPSREDLLRRAASYYALNRKREVTGIDDLEADFAEIDVLLRVDDVGSAFRAVERLDDVLENWGCRWMLLHQREQLRGRLGHELDEVINLQALGDIALLRDDFPAAEARYRQAISFVHGPEWLDVRKSLLDSLGSVLLRTGDTRRARDLYGDSLSMAREFDELEEEIVPLAGLSDCERRWGRIPESIEHLQRAIDALHRVAGDRPDTRRTTLLARLLVRLGRRLGDNGDVPAAEEAIIRAGELARQSASWSAQCQQADAWADLLLRQDRVRDAQQVAIGALGTTLELGSGPLARQIRTTLAVCALRLGDVEGARAHIEEADRHRAAGSSLVTAALAGIIEYRRSRWRAQEIFRRLLVEAVERGRRDPDDFAAYDMEGLARAGEHLGRRSPPLDAAILAFTRARSLTSAPGITEQLVALLREFQDDRLEAAISAASGTG